MKKRVITKSSHAGRSILPRGAMLRHHDRVVRVVEEAPDCDRQCRRYNASTAGQRERVRMWRMRNEIATG